MSVEEIQLVYQPVPPDRSDEVFASALEAVVADSEAVSLASPYLSFDVVRALVEGRNFRLVTDLGACLEGGVDSSLASFFEEHNQFIRSLRGLHAKVVLGANAGLLGSANLTTTGLCRRFEMACVVRGSRLDELTEWFDALWDHADPLDLEALAARKAEAPREKQARSTATKDLTTTGKLGWLGEPLRSPTPPDASTDTHTAASSGAVSDTEMKELARQLRRLTTTRTSARKALDLFAEALRLIKLPVDDKRLHLNFGRAPISITLGQRYIVWLRKERGTPEFGMLLADFDVAKHYVETMEGVRSSAFRAKGKPDVPSFYWPPEKIASLPDDVLESWRRGILRELNHCGASSYARKKREALYHVVMDPALRTMAVRLAHPSAWWFGVNNGRAGHMTLEDVAPLFEGSQLRWLFGNSKTLPQNAYAEMLPGDRVLVWTGQGRDERWGVIGTAKVGIVEEDHVVLNQGARFESPLTPYPSRQPAETNAVKFLLRVFGEEFKPLGDVRHAVHGVGRTNPITVAKIAEAKVDRVVNEVGHRAE